ncbi:hypothetical protein GCM10009737_29030 [Nocardioides lentus]|uniref:Uncharacterized protein n=1 Tax=Nocardioides lentus TaxID=338077 RepID=A0ABP5B0Y8_9ACTN
MTDPVTDPVTGPAPRAGGRRAAPRSRRRLTPAVVLAVVLPVASLATAWGLAPGAPTDAPDAGPARVALAEQTLVCPAPPDEPAPVLVGRAPGTGTGAVEVAAPAAEEDADPASADPPDGGVADPVVVADEPAVVQGRDDAAPGLLAARFTAGTVAGTACLEPAASAYLTGLGAGPESSTVLDLVNPETGPAVVDLTVLGPDGPLDVPDVAGVTVPAGESLRLDLARIVPTADDLAVSVEVVRGRAGVTALDRSTPVGGAETVEWLASQPAPGRELVLPGLVGGAGERRLVVANPGDAATQVELQVGTPGGAVTPVDVRPVQVPAGGVAAVDLSAEIAAQVDQGASSLLLTSAEPVTATLRSRVRDDVALTTATAAAPETAGLVAEGDARVVLALPAGAAATSAVVVARDADGEQVGSRTVDLDPGASVETDLPDAAAAVTVAADGDVAGAVVVRRGDGTLVLGLRPPVTDGLVPAVRPGLP